MPKANEAGPPPQEISQADEKEYMRCHPMRWESGFVRFCERHAWIQDIQAKRTVRFKLWPGQRRMVPDLVAGQNLSALKGRQVGWTELLVVWALYNAIFHLLFKVAVYNQEIQYAYDFIRRVNWVINRLPAYMRPTKTKDTESRIMFGAGSKDCDIRAFVGKAAAGRSFTGHLAIFDEAAYIEEFAAALTAIEPALAGDEHSSGGQIIVLTTSSGPTSEWAAHWKATYGNHGETLDDNGIGPNGFKAIFIHYSERPGRTKEWHAGEVRRLEKISKVAPKYEYPETIEEALEYAEGRVYPLFTRDRNVGDIKIPKFAKRCRAVDWGETVSAFVVLWMAYIKGPPGFLVSPSCPNMINEMLGYRFDKAGRPIKKKDHTCDAIRYAIVAHDMKGLVYVYRELYIEDSVARGWNPLTEINLIHEMSGWERADPESRKRYVPGVDGEEYRLPTVADRSLGKMINLFEEWNIPCIPSPTIAKPKQKGTGLVDKTQWELVEGIRQVATLIDGSMDMDRFHVVTREQRALHVYARTRRPGVTTGASERQSIALARSILLKQRRRRRT